MPSHVGELNYPSFVCQEEAITTPAPTDIKLLASVEGSICPCVASTLLRALPMDVFIPFPELLPWSFPFSASTDVDSAQKQFPMFLKDDASALPRCPLRTHSPPTDSLSLSLFFARRHQVARPPHNRRLAVSQTHARPQNPLPIRSDPTQQSAQSVEGRQRERDREREREERRNIKNRLQRYEQPMSNHFLRRAHR